MKEKTKSSSIRPSEVSVTFESESRSVIPLGSENNRQDSLAKIVGSELEDDRSVIYGKILIEYTNDFSQEKTHEANFSLKFTQQDELECEVFPYQPWNDSNEHPSLGG